MKFKIFLVLFLFIFCLPLFCDDYLVRVKFGEHKLYLINNIGIIINIYPVAIHESILNYLPLCGNVISIEKGLYPKIIIRFNAANVNPLFRIYGVENNVLLNKKSTRGRIVMQSKDIFNLIRIICGKQIGVLFER